MIRDAGDPFAIPEVTRGLRSFAAPSALGGAHDLFFAPLLDARRGANVALKWPQRLQAFDAERLDATLHMTLQSFAAEQYPASAPDRRALAARLEDACGDLFHALTALGAAATGVRAAPADDVRVEAWTLWILALRRVFSAADRGWENVRTTLGEGTAVAPRRLSRAPRRRKER